MRKLLFVLSVVVLVAAMAAPTYAQSGTIVDVAVANNFDTLVAAAQAAGLAGTLAEGGPFTVFAPTEGAFATLLNELDVSAQALLGDTTLLQQVLLYHVVPGRITAQDILASDLPITVRTVGGATLTVGLDAPGNRVQLDNGRASVISTNVPASNGIIHVIDNVLLPPAGASSSPVAASADVDAPLTASAGTGNYTIVEAAVANQFGTLVAAVQAAGLVETLRGPGPFTVFAPTDGAFETLLTELDTSAEDLLNNTALLEQVLLYHVVPGQVTSADILSANLPISATTAQGSTVSIGFDFPGNRVQLDGGRASVIAADVFTDNGVIHVIDNVLLP